MRANGLIRLYPRAWRERYADEFLATVGDRALHFQQVIDIVAGAIDAWLSSEVRNPTRPGQISNTANGGTVMHAVLKAGCGQTKVRYTKRDALVGAGVMLGVSLVCSVLGVLARRNGMPLVSEFLLSLAFPGSLTLSMPFTFLKGHSWRVQAIIVGGMMAILMAITYLATKI